MPDPDQSTTGPTGPLRGVKVVELAALGPAPFACTLLSDLGAEVILVERPNAERTLGTWRTDAQARGRRPIAVDLKHPDAAELVLSLVERADVFVEGFRPGVAERLGLGPEACLARRPSLVYGRMTGWGQEGPLAQAAGHDITYLAVTGVLHAIGTQGGPPQIPLHLLGDLGGGGMYLVVGILAALAQAQRTGQGQVVDASIVDGTLHLATGIMAFLSAGLWNDERGTNLLDGGRPFYSVYETADHRYVAVGSLEPKFFAELMRVLGGEGRFPEQYDPACWPEMRRWLAERFAERTRDEWAAAFDGTDACVAPVLSLTEAQRFPHLVSRGNFSTIDGITHVAPAPRFSRTPATIQGPPASPGSRTREVLEGWGIGGVDELFSAGVVG